MQEANAFLGILPAEQTLFSVLTRSVRFSHEVIDSGCRETVPRVKCRLGYRGPYVYRRVKGDPGLLTTGSRPVGIRDSDLKKTI